MANTTLEAAPPPSAPAADNAGFALALAWSADRTPLPGEVLLLPSRRGGRYIFGRGGPRDGEPLERLLFAQQRPGALRWSPPVEAPFLSRSQLELAPREGGVWAKNVGRCPMLVGGSVVGEALIEPGTTLELKGQMLLLCVERAPRMAAARYAVPAADHPFGEADGQGLVGESPQAWALRDAVAFVAGRSASVLVQGESGTGKELVAQAIHALSPRAGRKLVARNATTLPSGLIDAELFGNVKNYPHAGMPERPGLVGEASGGTLFLDEIGDLPGDLQTHLLRVLDEGGDYQRLGEASRRKADVRLIGATNRPLAQLREDLAARLPLRVAVPSLGERLEDIPLLARHLLRKLARQDPEIGRRFLAGWDGAQGEPRLSLPLVQALLAHRYTTHTRELGSLLWRSIAESPGDLLLAPPSLAQAAASPAQELGRDALLAALARAGGVQERAWRDLGLANRYVLKRLLKKHGISPE